MHEQERLDAMESNKKSNNLDLPPEARLETITEEERLSLAQVPSVVKMAFEEGHLHGPEKLPLFLMTPIAGSELKANSNFDHLDGAASPITQTSE